MAAKEGELIALRAVRRHADDSGEEVAAEL
jgi:hypothetical protein